MFEGFQRPINALFERGRRQKAPARKRLLGHRLVFGGLVSFLFGLSDLLAESRQLGLQAGIAVFAPAKKNG